MLIVSAELDVPDFQNLAHLGALKFTIRTMDLLF